MIDASVIVSACYGGISRDAVIYIFSNHKVYISESIIEEFKKLEKKFQSKIGKERVKKFKELSEELLKMAQKVTPEEKINLCRDETDNKYLSVCKKIKADYLLTWDEDLIEIDYEKLKKVSLKKLKIMTPSNFLVHITKGK